MRLSHSIIESFTCLSIIWNIFMCVTGEDFGLHTNEIHHDIPSRNFTPGVPLSQEEKDLAKSLSWTKYYTKSFEMDSNPNFFEGDIIVDKRAKRRQDGGGGGGVREYLRGKIRWPNGIVPYIIENTYSGKDRLLIARAIEEIESVSCVRFVPRTYQKDFIYIHKGQNCASSVGRVGGGQSLSLTSSCLFFGIILHELMHVLGFWHEHSRFDRSDYVDIHWRNINPMQMNNFFINPRYIVSDVGLPYDYSSILHYGPMTFARSPYQPSITPKKKYARIGQRAQLSKLNIEAINRFYKCRRRRANLRRPFKANRLLYTPHDHTLYMPRTRCLDVHWSCPMGRIFGWCTYGKPFMGNYCRKTCGFCRS